MEIRERMLAIFEASKKIKRKELEGSGGEFEGASEKEKKVRMDDRFNVQEYVRSFFPEKPDKEEEDYSESSLEDMKNKMETYLVKKLDTLDLSGEINNEDENDYEPMIFAYSVIVKTIVPFLKDNAQITGLDVSRSNFDGRMAVTLFKHCKLERFMAVDSNLVFPYSSFILKELKSASFSSDSERCRSGEDFLDKESVLVISNSCIEKLRIKGVVKNEDISLIINNNDRLKNFCVWLEDFDTGDEEDEKDKLKAGFLKIRDENFRLKKLSFLTGSHSRLGEQSPILMFSRRAGRSFRDISKEIFEYIEPNKLTLKFP